VNYASPASDKCRIVVARDTGNDIVVNLDRPASPAGITPGIRSMSLNLFMIKSGIADHVAAPFVSISDTGDIIVWVVEIVVFEKQELISSEIGWRRPRPI
jgi:hypothetical protein